MDLKLEVGMLFVTAGDCKILKVKKRMGGYIVAVNPLKPKETRMIKYGAPVLTVEQFLKQYNLEVY